MADLSEGVTIAEFGLIFIVLLFVYKTFAGIGSAISNLNLNPFAASSDPQTAAAAGEAIAAAGAVGVGAVGAAGEMATGTQAQPIDSVETQPGD